LAVAKREVKRKEALRKSPPEKIGCSVSELLVKMRRGGICKGGSAADTIPLDGGGGREGG